MRLKFEYEYLDFDLEDDYISAEEGARVLRQLLLEADQIGNDDKVVITHGPG